MPTDQIAETHEPLWPYVLVARKHPKTIYGSIILTCEQPAKSFECTVLKVYEGCRMQVGDIMVVPVNNFLKLPDATLDGFVDVADNPDKHFVKLNK